MTVVTSARMRLASIVAGAMLAGGVIAGTAVAYQPHMVNALHALQAAHSQLELAVPDKAGYRVQALGLVDQAINAVNAGIAAGAR